MSATPTAPAVPCLAGLYAALGADETGAPAMAPTPMPLRLAAAMAAGVLAISLAVWPGSPSTVVAQLPDTADRPAATLPEWPDLLADFDG